MEKEEKKRKEQVAKTQKQVVCQNHQKLDGKAQEQVTENKKRKTLSKDGQDYQNVQDVCKV